MSFPVPFLSRFYRYFNTFLQFLLFFFIFFLPFFPFLILSFPFSPYLHLPLQLTADYSVLSFRLFSPLFQDFNKIINSLKDCVGDFIQVFIFLQRS